MTKSKFQINAKCPMTNPEILCIVIWEGSKYGESHLHLNFDIDLALRLGILTLTKCISIEW